MAAWFLELGVSCAGSLGPCRELYGPSALKHGWEQEWQHSSLYGISYNYRLPLFGRPGGEVKYLLLGINGGGGRFFESGPSPAHSDWSERCQHLLLLFVNKCQQCSNQVQNWQHMVDFGVFVFLALLVSEISTAEWSQWFSLSEKWFMLCKNKAWCKQSCIHWNEGCSPQTFERTFPSQFFREDMQVFPLVWIPVSGQLSWTVFSAITVFCPGLALKLSI